MQVVAVSTFRSNLQKYLHKAELGEEIHLTSRGHEIARILPPENESEKAKQELKKLRKHCKVGDVLSPIDIKWEANS